MDNLGYLLSQLIMAAPMFGVLIGGLALLTVYRRTVRSSGLAVAGCAVLLFCASAGLAWSMGFPYLSRGAMVTLDRLAATSFGIGMVLTLGQATGVALLIAAVVRGNRATRGPVQDQPPTLPEWSHPDSAR